MPKKQQRKAKPLPNGRNGTEQYVPMPYAMLHSDAWRSLSGGAVKVWLELRTRFNGGNNGKLHLSLDEGARLLGLSKTTVKRALDELEAKGFVAKTKAGQWYGRQATEWRLTDCPHNGALATRDWREWRPPKNRVSVSTRHDEAA